MIVAIRGIEVRRFIVVTALALAAAPCALLSPGRAVHAAAPVRSAATAAGGAVSYADLEHHVGERIAVQSSYGTVRRGVLKSWNNIEVVLDVEFGTGTLELTMPKDTIASVELLGPKAPPSATREPDRAQAH
jgi:hypothetical protein